MTPAKNILRIAISRPLYSLLDYQCPDELTVQIGCRVQVPLAGGFSVGIVVKKATKSEFKKLRNILKVLDKEPLIEENSLQLLYWASRYYHHPIGDVIFNAIPAPLRKGKTLPLMKVWQLNTKLLEQADSLLGRAHKQRQLWLFFEKSNKNEWLSELQINQGLEQSSVINWKNLLRELIKKQLILVKEIPATFTALPRTSTPDKEITLTDEQQDVLKQLTLIYQAKKIKPILLHGITGSGKTEIYLRTIAPVLKSGKQALILVPEIGLTPQLFKRFQQYFPQYCVAMLHSALSDSERTLIWQAVKDFTIDIVIGTRSAVFSPMKKLGIIIVDEEHDGSLKQQTGFRYHGRDLAVKRAYDLNIPIILGSATPALESLQNVERDRYHYLRLNSRPGSRTRPVVLVQDIRGLVLEAGISSLLLKEIQQHLEADNQVMLFLNRRGFAPVLYCPSCGWHAICQSCDTNMTYHAGISKIICHHCAREKKVSLSCPDCHHKGITTVGQGTERIEHVLQTHFPEFPVVRIDRDTTRRKGALDSKLAIVQQGKPVILVGTQMLTKGHDFPKLTLVGILDIDQALFSMDYRAQEQLAQQIVQVSGRAGRGESKGRVLLQTSQPEHPLLTNLLNKGYLNIAKQLLSERKRWNYPPFGFQVLIRVTATDKIKGFVFLQKLSQDLSLSDLQQPDVTLLGPVPSPMAKKADRYRFQLLMSSANRAALHYLLTDAVVRLQAYKKSGNIRWSVDVDPLNML
ncbi:MAG: primosomal protein N' [Cocleimonas sp.]|nr:primosomal protein N' [Cocleimonas sp.]